MTRPPKISSRPASIPKAKFIHQSSQKSFHKTRALAGLGSLCGPLTAIGGLLATLGAAFIVSSPAAGSIPIMKVKDIRPGMKGTAYTVFSGTEPEPFAVEIVDVIPSYLPKQDLILFRSSDPRLVHSGIVGGMSGSPIFIDSKLIGALAYGWRFNKDPLGGITPIENMLEVDKLPYRPEVNPQYAASAGLRSTTEQWADLMLGLGVSPVPPKKRAHISPEVSGLTKLSVPLSVSGMGPMASRYLGEQLGLQTVPGGGTSKQNSNKPAKKKKWRPGDSVSVLLASGDSSAAPNGTVTWVGGQKGERLLAYGHPFSSLGPTNLPISDARVHVIIPSRRRSVKLSSPLTNQGTMIQDRQAAISLRTDIEAPMIPVITTAIGSDRTMAPRIYRNEVADSALLTPQLVTTFLLEALDEAAPDAVPVTTEVEHVLAITTSKGPRTLRLKQESFFPEGVLPSAIARHRAVVLMNLLLDNEFEIAKIRSIEQSAKVTYGAPVEKISGVSMVTDEKEIKAGSVVQLQVTFEAPRKADRIETFSIRIPEDAGDEDVVIEIAAGPNVHPYRPIAKSLDDLLDTVEQYYSARNLVVSIYRQAEGLSTESGLLQNLPSSVIEGLSTSGTTTKDIRFKQVARRVLNTPNIVVGSLRLTVAVRSRRTLDALP